MTQAAKIKCGITPTSHDLAKWARIADAASVAGRPDVACLYRAASVWPQGRQMSRDAYDDLANPYRVWLALGTWS